MLPTFDAPASRVHTAPPPWVHCSKRGIARGSSRGERGRGWNSIPNPGVINDVSRSPDVGLRREGFATHEIFLGQRPLSCAHLGYPGYPGLRPGGGGNLVHDFLVSGGRLEFLAVVNTFYEILWEIFINPGMSRRGEGEDSSLASFPRVYAIRAFPSFRVYSKIRRESKRIVRTLRFVNSCQLDRFLLSIFFSNSRRIYIL